MTVLATPGRRRAVPRPQGRAARRLLYLLVLGAPVLGYAALTHAKYALVAGVAVLVAGLFSLDRGLLVVAAVPATMLVFRVGGSSSNLSFSDLTLFVATLTALTAFRWSEAPVVRRLLWLLAVYEGALVLTLAANPYRANFLEWAHEALLVGGSLIVGWVVARDGRSEAATASFLVLAGIVAMWACAYSLTHHLTAVYLPLGMQKNYIGDMLAFAAVIAYAGPAWAGPWVKRHANRFMALCILGILASQSKQAMVSLIAGAAVLLLRDRRFRRRSLTILAALVPLAVVAYVTVSREFASSNQFNSVHQRQTWLRDSLSVWHISPLVGIGLRWWYTNRVQFHFQPPNAEAEVLTSAGLIGLAAFLVLALGSIWVVWHLPTRYATLAAAVLIMRLVQGQLDIFWVSAQEAIPWLIVGMCLAGGLRESRHRGDRWPAVDLSVP